VSSITGFYSQQLLITRIGRYRTDDSDNHNCIIVTVIIPIYVYDYKVAEQRNGKENNTQAISRKCTLFITNVLCGLFKIRGALR
jgi:hypothetical protein